MYIVYIIAVINLFILLIKTINLNVYKINYGIAMFFSESKCDFIFVHMYRGYIDVLGKNQLIGYMKLVIYETYYVFFKFYCRMCKY